MAFVLHGCVVSQSVSDDWDKEVVLPRNALSHDTFAEIGREERVTLRRCCWEVVSEQSNYLVYRSEMGGRQGFLPDVLRLSHTLLRSTAERNGYCTSDDNDLFMLDRILNCLANWCFDLDRAIVSKDGSRFQIVSQDRTVSMRGYKDAAVASLPCYLLNALGRSILTFIPGVKCVQLQRTMARLIANTSLIINARLLFRLAMYDPVYMMRMLLVNLQVSRCERHPEFVRESGARACRTALKQLGNGYHRVHGWHWTELTWTESLS
jgi:hypothetical protein